MYKRTKKNTVQLTSLLDLLFVMIFVSLMQQKAKDMPEESKAPVKKEEVVAKKKEAVVEKPKQTKFSLQAIFTFSSTPSNQKVPKGSFLMAGSYNAKSGDIKLGGISWINRPKNYGMVPLSGVMNSKIGIFKGQIDFQGCKTFTLKRENKVTGSPVAGKWVGIYDCQQGETALTLEIE